MANIAQVLEKAIAGQKNPTAAVRQVIYQRARQTFEKKLMEAGLPPELAQRQRDNLEHAILAIEAKYQQNDVAYAPPPAAHETHISYDDVSDNPSPSYQETIPQHDTYERSYDSSNDADAYGHTVDQYGEQDHYADYQDDYQDGDEGQAAEPVGHYASDRDPQLYDEEQDYGDDEAYDDAEAYDDDYYEDDIDDETLDPYAPVYESNDRISALFAEVGKREKRARLKKIIIYTIIALIALAAIGAGGYWVAKNFMGDFLNPQQQTTDTDTQDDTANNGATTSEQPENTKLTQRLLPDGQEVDPGPAQQAVSPDRATSTTSATPTGIRLNSEEMLFTEYSTGQSNPTTLRGYVTWSIEQQPASEGAAPEPVIKGDIIVPDKNFSLRLFIRRNADRSLPASYLIDFVFITPDDFSGGVIHELNDFALKPSAQSTVEAHLTSTIMSKISDNLFIAALPDNMQLATRNLAQLNQLQWFKLDMTYSNGQHAQMLVAKGVSGNDVFNRAFSYWTQMGAR